MAKILIVEGDLAVRALLVSSLEEMGHAAFASPNAGHAWETLEANHDIALIIVDAMLRGSEGDALIQLIRDDSTHADLPIIVVSTGYVAPTIIDKMLEHGAGWFMSKPINVRQLETYVTRSLELYQAQVQKCSSGERAV